MWQERASVIAKCRVDILGWLLLSASWGYKIRGRKG